jgi:hypothetical protein
MDQPTTKRWNKRMVMFVANSDERQIDRTMMAAWSVRQKHPDAPIAIVTDKPTHRIWRTGLFNVVVSSADNPGATMAECIQMAMRREVFDRAIVLNSHLRLRADSILPVLDTLDDSPVSLAANKTAEGVRLSGLAYAVQRSDEAHIFLEAMEAAERENDGDTGRAMNKVVGSGMLRGSVKFRALGADWIPAVASADSELPRLEVRRGDSRRLYAEMLMFAMHRLVSSDMKRAATIYARVAISSRPDLPQLGAPRLVEHMVTTFQDKAPDMSGRNREQLKALLDHAAEEDPAGNLLGIAALHLEMGQMKTALAVLRMIYRMKFAKPVPVPG